MLCDLSPLLLHNGEDAGEGLGRLTGDLKVTLTLLLSLSRERRPSACAMPQFPAILKSTPLSEG